MPARKKLTREAITTVSARQHFSDLINRVAYGKDRIVLTRRNRPLAAVVPIEVKRKGTVPWTLIKKDLGLN
jgi:prevent-host-death family protein